MQEEKSRAPIQIVVAMISGTCIILAALVTGFADRIADRLLPPLTPTSASIVMPLDSTPVIPNNIAPDDLIIDGVGYSYPNSTTTPFCVAQQIHTNGENKVKYQVRVPKGWVMVWDSNKAYWTGGQYENNGLLIIIGEWSGTIEIDTGGSCSGPLDWYDFIIQNRRADYPIASRPEFYLGQIP